jgi:hypothetical protein
MYRGKIKVFGGDIKMTANNEIYELSATVHFDIWRQNSLIQKYCRWPICE